jgi:hypothetical protein
MIRRVTYPIAAPDTATSSTWRDRAACADIEDPEVMFPHSDKKDIDRAKAVCAGCPVVGECLEAVMAEEGIWGKERRHGIRGGLTGGQRRGLYERRRAAAPKPEPVKEKPKPKPRSIPKCGTRGGYQRHVRNHEPIDDACRQANTDADNRLRRTGTTKQAA